MLKAGVDRRAFLVGMGSVVAAGLAGCSSTTRETVDTRATQVLAARRAEGALLYAAKPDEQFPLPAIPHQKIDPKFYRQMVADPTGEAPGTLVVDTGNHYLYFTYPNGQAMRYGVGLGRAGFAWAGRGKIQYKRQWPKWTPPDEMIARQPELAKYSADNGGMPPSLDNPLGARALYIFQGKEDTLYRIHGSPEWWTIGKSVSSGCVRMINQDVVDLFNRVPDGTQIVVTDLSRPGVESVNDVRGQEIYEPYRPNEAIETDDSYVSADASRMPPRSRRRYLDDDPYAAPAYDDPYYVPGY
ncbi:MAG: L,D-transpeptidase [Rhizobium sp.]|nr:L,D-transpeptidase [Rhizobium sp.]